MHKLSIQSSMALLPHLRWLAQVSLPYLLLNRKAEVLWSNVACQEAVGFEEALPENWLVDDLQQPPEVGSKDRFEDFMKRLDEQALFEWTAYLSGPEGTKHQIKLEIVPDTFAEQALFVGRCVSIVKVGEASPITTRLAEGEIQANLLTSLLGNTQSVFVLKTDYQGLYTYIGPKYHSTFKVDPIAVIGTSSFAHIIHEDHPKCLEAASRCIEQPGVPQRVTLRKPTPDGQILSNDWAMVALPSSQEILCIGVDISTLTKSKQDYEMLVANISDNVFTINKEGEISFVSPGWTRNFGYGMEETIGQHFSSFAHPEELEMLTDVSIREIKQRTGQSMTHRIRHKDGGWRWVETKVRIDPIAKTLVFISRDVTAQRADAETLARQASFLAQTQKIGKIGGWEYEVATQAFTWTEEVYRIYGVGPDFKITLETAATFYHPEDRTWVLNAFAESAQNQTGLDLISRFLSFDGKEIWVRVIANPVLTDGQVSHFKGLIQDVTKERTAELAVVHREEMLQKLTQNVPGVIYQFELSPQGGMTFPYISEQIFSLLPYVTADLLKEDAEALFKYAHPGDIDQMIVKMMASKENLTEFVHEFRVYPDGEAGEVKWFRATSAPEIRADGTTVWYGIFQDITAQKQTKWELDKANDLLKMSQHMVKVGSYEKDLVKGTWTASESYINLFGLPQKEVYTIDEFNELIHPEDYEMVMSCLEHSIEAKQDFKLNFRCVRPDGATIYVAARCRIEYGADGKPLRIIGAKQDVTEQTLAARSIEENESRLRLLTGSMQEVFWLRSADNSQMLYISPAYERVWGRSCESLLENPNEFLEAVHPDDRDRVLAAFMAYADTGQYELEHRIIHAEDQCVRWVYARQSAVFNEEGEIIHHSGIAKDITESKQQEEQIALLKSVVEKGQDAILITQAEPIDLGANGPKIIYANPAFYRMTGYRPSEVIGKTPRILQGPNSNARELKRIHSALENWETIEVEMINYRKDGSEYWVNFIITPIADEKGWFTHWVSIQRDVTARKMEELELIRTKEAAERASQAKSEFLSHMSHEIRTPLNAVIGMTGLLAETSLDEEQAFFLKTIRQGGETLLSVINDILDYSKIESGQMELETASFELLDPIEDTLELLAEKAHRKGLDILYQAIEPLPQRVIGDITRIRQILVNLVGNAIKFTEAGEILVSVKQRSATPSHITLEFSVKDTGEGIPAEKMHRLFKSFSQVDASTTRKHGGTGLGLAISQQLVQLHGGTIWVESEMGEGSCFFFTIKAIRDKQAPIQPKSVQSLKEKVIWLVDDNTTNLIIQERLLKKHGAIIRRFESPQLAVDAYKEAGGQSIPLIITDMEMPEMDGIAFGRHIQQICPHQSIMLLSSSGRAQRAEQKSLFSGIMQKPARNQEFIKKVVSLMIDKSLAKDVASQEEATGEIDLSAFQILLVEDNKVNQRVAQRMLAKFGAKVEIANNGQEGLDYAKLRRFDLVLMDMQMPVMDGLTATREIRALEVIHQPYILAMTANASQTDRARCFDAGMNDFISKPIKLDELRQYLKKWLLTPVPVIKE